jgi:Sec-independent protein translocase protein TatA
MSLFEFLVVIIVGILVIKPEDLPKIIAKLKEMRVFINNTKKEIMSHLDPISELQESSLEDFNQDMDQINFYLGKIANLGSEYNGDYSLRSIKDHYHKLVQDQIKQNNPPAKRER